jgi:hypothetical protein
VAIILSLKAKSGGRPRSFTALSVFRIAPILEGMIASLKDRGGSLRVPYSSRVYNSKLAEMLIEEVILAKKLSHREPSGHNSRSPWLAETARLTAFPTTNVMVKRLNWWKLLLKSPPKSITLQDKTGVRQEQGDFETGRLVLSIGPGRIDWMFLPRSDPNSPQDEVSLHGPFPEGIQPFLDLMYRWLKLCPELKRLAFGATLVLAVDTPHEANQQISLFLPFDISHEKGKSDLIYRINRPKKSKTGVPDLRIERLRTWSTAAFQMLTLTGGQPTRTDYMANSCRLELDLSTAADFPRSLPRSKVTPIFKEMVNLGCEIAEKGDLT